MITPTNISKNAISPTNQSRQGFFLLMEDGSYLLQESGFKFILDAVSYGFSGTNISKNAISPTGVAKS
jgi:hypothetical protein